MVSESKCIHHSAIAGYPSGLVRAERASGVHLAYGIDILELIRSDTKVEAVLTTDCTAGLDDHLLAEVGIQGSLPLPWRLITNFEAGYAVASPGKGCVALGVFFLGPFPD